MSDPWRLPSRSVSSQLRPFQGGNKDKPSVKPSVAAAIAINDRSSLVVCFLACMCFSTAVFATALLRGSFDESIELIPLDISE